MSNETERLRERAGDLPFWDGRVLAQQQALAALRELPYVGQPDLVFIDDVLPAIYSAGLKIVPAAQPTIKDCLMVEQAKAEFDALDWSRDQVNFVLGIRELCKRLIASLEAATTKADSTTILFAGDGETAIKAPVTEQAAETGSGLSAVVKFLCGEEPLEGVWFGQPHPSGKPYWWRSRLCQAISAAEREGGCDHEEGADGRCIHCGASVPC